MQIIFGRLVQFIGSFIVLKSLLTIFDSLCRDKYLSYSYSCYFGKHISIGFILCDFNKKWLSENILKNKLDMIIFCV